MPISTFHAVAYSGLLLATAATHQISSTPPRIAQESSNHLLEKDGPARKPVDEKKKNEALHERKGISKWALRAVATTKYIVWSIIGLEVAVRILSLFPTGRLSAAILPVAIPALRPTIGIQVEPRTWMIPTLTSAPSSAFYLGVLTVGVGFAIRLSCFRTLGRHFSFLHTTLAGHRLISGGPYGVVRHPSYTGEVLVRFGVLAILLRADGIVAASGALSMATTTFASDVSQVAIPVVAHAVLVGLLRAAIAGYAGWISFACPYLLLRARKEDATLRESFGKEWDEYAARVPYRFIPYIA